MLPAANSGAGQNMGFPDVCNTPAGPATVPIPYPNIAMNAQATGFSAVVKVTGCSALNMSSKIPKTMGDEAGTAGPFGGVGQYTMGNPIVKIDQQPAINLTCPTSGNNMVCSTDLVAVPSAVNVMYCLAPLERSAAEADVDLAELTEVMLTSSVAEAELLRGEVAYLRLRHVGPDTATAVFAAADRLRGQALVLDLRDNRGGDIAGALRLADDLLPPDAVIAHLDQIDGDQVTYRCRAGLAHTCPVVLIIDRQTASAAELLAACLRDHRRALIVGEHSYGKRSAYAIHTGPDRQPRRQLLGTWRSPNEGPASKLRPIKPDVPVAGGEGDSALKTAWALALEMVTP